MSGLDKKPKIPQPPAPASSSGNLLSSVAPPSQLPNFVTASPVVPAVEVPQSAISQPLAAPLPAVGQPIPAPLPVKPIIVQGRDEPPPQADIAETFSPAIPLNKGEPLMSIRSPEDSQASQSPDSLPDSTSEIDKLGDIMPGSGLLTWMKGAVSTGGLLQRVAEKAKSSVDTMITTLDPQMKEYLRSGGDLLVVVASDKEVKVSPIREAFQTVFGKANVVWYDMSLMVLSQPSLGIELQLQSQGTPVPAAAIAAAAAATPSDYAHAQTGYSVTIGSIMAASLQVPHTQWQEASTGVSRRDLLQLTARSLAGSYKRLLAVSANEA